MTNTEKIPKFRKNCDFSSSPALYLIRRLIVGAFILLAFDSLPLYTNLSEFLRRYCRLPLHHRYYL